MNVRPLALPKTRKGLERRAQIIDVATRAFAVQGYRKVTLAAIAEAIGLTEQGVMHYFPTKEHLLVSVLDEQDVAADAEATRRLVAEAPTMLDGLLAAQRARLANRPEATTLISVLMAESVDPEHAAHEWFVERNRRMRSYVTAMFEQAQSAGHLRADVDVTALAIQIVALFDGLVVQRALDPEAFDIVEVFERFLAPLRP